ncbi:DUF7002 family protein [Kiloniella litopenaei]|uniref:DUF7002 family protein n=1 Tax=Kiloniella litopenaei TaxID=1549748 RepID=UPI003BAA0259
MNKEELEELIQECPSLYHMAERHSWESIQKHGLLSTSALLNMYEIVGEKRFEIEQTRRDKSILINKTGLHQAVIRDQLPMDDKGLMRALPPEISPADWYRLLNSKVFFWLTKDRLYRLTDARTYRDKEHDVLELDTRKLIEVHYHDIVLCPINSGCTKPYPANRDYDSFLPIDEYPYQHWKSKRGKRGDKAVELVVNHSVPDVTKFIRRVSVMKGTEELEVLFEK